MSFTSSCSTGGRGPYRVRGRFGRQRGRRHPIPRRAVRRPAGRGAVCARPRVRTALCASESPVGCVSEDCLHLDVTVPEGGAGHKPVLVWLHGATTSGTVTSRWRQSCSRAYR
ncbi:carboxylesterase family protein [Flindersiella endophytica]